MTIEDCETTTIASPIVEKTIELASTFSSRVWVLHIVPATNQSPYNVDSKMFRRDVATEFCQEHDFLQHLAKCMRDKNIDASSLLVKAL